MLDPSTYFQAAVWRMRGLKVRSRNSISPLLGRSRHAYALWMIRNEQWRGLRACSAKLGPLITPVIDCRAGAGGLDITLMSLKDAGPQSVPVVIGGPDRSGTKSISHPRQLGQIACAEGSWLCPMLPGDRLAPNAFDIYSAAAAAGTAALIYADDDLIAGEVRYLPHFKPQWNPDLFEHHDYLTGASIVLALPDALAHLPERGWAEELVAKALLREGAPRHMPRVLHHRVARPSPKVPPKPRDPAPERLPLVSVIVPTRNHLPLLRKCLDGLRQCNYPRIEVIVIDNDSDDPATLDYIDVLERTGVAILRVPGPFNYSKLNNVAAREARGDLLCFLNNDVEMVDNDWLGLLVRQALRPDVGAVGALLLYPDRTIQHAGVFLGIGGGAGHGHRHQREDETGYFERARLPQRVSGVTAACLVVARDKFYAVGGFDEMDFPVAFNDVDLCLKLNSRGWNTLYEPRAILIHHESKSRGSDISKAKKARFARELAALKRKWRTDLKADPYHHPHLSRFSEQFLIAI